MVKLSYSQQSDEIRDLEHLIFQRRDLDIVEIQVQQLKRLIYFTKRSLRNLPDRKKPDQNQEFDYVENGGSGEIQK